MSFVASDPAGAGQLVPPRLLPLRGVRQGLGRGAVHRGPAQQHLLRGRLQQVRTSRTPPPTPFRRHSSLNPCLFRLRRTFAPKCAACLQPILPTEVSAGKASKSWVVFDKIIVFHSSPAASAIIFNPNISGPNLRSRLVVPAPIWLNSSRNWFILEMLLQGSEEILRVVSMNKDYHFECYHCEVSDAHQTPLSVCAS